MNSLLISTSSLAPEFSLPSLSQSAANLSALLLGQERAVDAFKLHNAIAEQQLYLADFPGIDRHLMIRALMDTLTPMSTAYLVATRPVDEAIQFQWQHEQPLDNQGCITEKNVLYRYLSGNIRRVDLLGRMVQSGNSSKYQAGALAQCHYLFICAESLWKRENLWDLVMQILTQKEYQISSTLSPIPLNCKIVLVGAGMIYSQVRSEDWQFQRHFTLLAELASEIDLMRYKESQYAAWLQAVAQSVDVTLEQSSLAPLFRYSARLTEHQRRLSLSMLDFAQLMAQAKAYRGKPSINASDIEYALSQANYRHNSSEEFSGQSFDDNFINLPTTGAMVGQINGLTVIDAIDYSYGEPARITASVHYGDGEVADIERKSELGGNIHAKGMMILSACLYRIFGRDAPLHLNANIVFEQSYQEIDGDSASLAEYCCLMSAIAEQPIIQSLAITGALDQFGNVQAIGGINEKIEGFFNLCERRGLTGEQGVIMPRSNILQLNLDPKVITAVGKGLFHIYAIEHMDEAVELLMQMPAGVADEDNDFPHDSLYGLVQERLDKLAGNGEEEIGIMTRLLAKLGLFRR
ncbi:AAA family ATPase [Shewanella putrefaciens]|uniref:endopeptidase La n=2 Tax=Shewanella putrefaciens TaxID=24 RepID=E6XHE8_SHEP2|nr:AAA family ATPase [Shewanella putrefaciens]AVV82712.1 ATP-dependent protease [Shewanella putrefaciens]MCT8942051.1 AAA family ATPase [Shewanella putrefaciens]MDR6966004.1 putative ATP-dependent protease [Shewanella putrefaciens]QSE50894.1 AAA family ATPase [Shewanella putrefaciens]QYX74305.1 AAA family ATPase [Shewanella putrefaciens]